jgi:HTH-type transcriptional regulator/antitoxin HigA
MIKVIRTDADYEAALAAVNELIEEDPSPGSSDAERLELLGVLIEDFERKHFALAAPSAVDAIRFRMEQQGLTQKDLVPFIGSRSRVSEVLSGKRALTLPMIRALHSGLGIPASSLVTEESVEAEELDWSQFPLAEMMKRGWITGPLGKKRVIDDPKQTLRQFFGNVTSGERLAALYRRTSHVRAGRSMDRYALLAWTVRIMDRAKGIRDLGFHNAGTISPALLSEVARLSTHEDGPVRAREFLARHGVALVIEPQLPRTTLDGVAVLLSDGTPTIGLTLRYDRIDNFWFTLMHELAHVSLHLSGSDATREEFIDDLDVGPGDDPRELEADRLAGESLIPEAEWRASAASKVRAVPAVINLAHKLAIHPAIVAGRVRHHYRDFRVLQSLVGQGEVRRWFPEVRWP